MKQLVLFDIDGTLVDVRGAGRRAFVRALERTWGVNDLLADVNFAGATDLGVLRQLRGRLPLDDVHDRAFFAHMEQTLLAELAAERPRIYDGVEPYLATLVARGIDDGGDTALGFVTGNAKACAWVKVDRAGLDRRGFGVGGYGDEHHDRPELARLAKERAEARAGHTFERVLLVGDTPSDVQAAKHIGAVAVGVTTGHFTRQQLVDAGADVVVDRLDQLS